MQIHLVTIGKVKEPYLREGISEYVKRLSALCTIQITEYPESRIKDNPGPSEIRAACQEEGLQLLKSSASAGFRIGLDPYGKQLSSEGLAQLFKKWEIEGPHQISVLIGGPHGLSDDVRKTSDLLVSLSPMTFPHQLVRLLLLEQIYRAYTINRGLPYHR